MHGFLLLAPPEGILFCESHMLVTESIRLGNTPEIIESSNDPAPPCQLDQYYRVLQLPRSLCEVAPDSREGISVIVVSLTHPSSSTYQSWISTCCFKVNPLLSQSLSATLHFHCHHHTEPRGPNSAARFGGPSAALHS